MTAGRKSFAETRPDLLEFYSERNTKNPYEISEGSHRRVWWKCPQTQFEWTSQVRERVSAHEKCVCCGKRARATPLNNLGKSHPEVVRDWDWDKNIGVSPSELTPSSKVKIDWKCRMGHEVRSNVKQRVKTKCPYCIGNPTPEKNLLALHPETSMWDSSKNPPTVHPSNILFVEVFSKSEIQKPWWKCSGCGFSWQDSINKFILRGCPKCKNTGDGKIENLYGKGAAYFSDEKYNVLSLAVETVKKEFPGEKIRFLSMPHLGYELWFYKNHVNLDCKNSLAIEKHRGHKKFLKKILDYHFESMPLQIEDVDSYVLRQNDLPFNVVHLDYNGGLRASHLDAAIKILKQPHKVVLFMTVNKTLRNQGMPFDENNFPLSKHGKELFVKTYQTNRKRCPKEFVVVAYTNL